MSPTTSPRAPARTGARAPSARRAGRRSCSRAGRGWQVLGAAALLLAAMGAPAQDGWPSRALRLVAPFPAGGATDVVARMVAARLGDDLGQPVTVENRPGAGGSVGADVVARSAPDGHTLLLAGGNVTIHRALHGPGTLDPLRAFVPITRIVTQPVVITAYPGFPANTVAEALALARQSAQPIAYATAGIGTSPHLAAVLLSARAGVGLLHVPYSTATSPQRDVVSGLVPLSFSLLAAVQPYVASGQLKPVAVTGSTRLAAWPQVPTVAESGLPGFEAGSWYGVLAAAGTPPAIVDRLHAALARMLQVAEVRERLATLGMQPAGDPPERFAAFLAADIARWTELARTTGLRLQ